MVKNLEILLAYVCLTEKIYLHILYIYYKIKLWIWSSFCSKISTWSLFWAIWCNQVFSLSGVVIALKECYMSVPEFFKLFIFLKFLFFYFYFLNLKKKTTTY